MTAGRDLLIDVSRLIWRVWRGGLPTGVDRVCIAYLEHFRSRGLAVIQRSGVQLVLSASRSDRLFDILLHSRGSARSALIRFLLTARTGVSRRPPTADMIYLNVGHTGLDESALPRWLAEHRIRAVYLVHDLIPIIHPQYCRPGEAVRHRRRLENVLASAAGVIGNSQATIGEMRGFAEGKGLMMPPSLAAWISGRPKAQAPSAKQLPEGFFITIGTIEARKNHLLLLETWRELVSDSGQRAPKLIIVGQRGWEAGPALAILDNLGALKDHVLELGACSDEELAAWLAGSEALLMPSFAEGFGLPVIEALDLGTPVIASDLPVFREIAGDIPLYLDPADKPGWLNCIRTFSPSETKRQRDGMRNWRAPDWSGHFAKVEAWLCTL